MKFKIKDEESHEDIKEIFFKATGDDVDMRIENNLVCWFDGEDERLVVNKHFLKGLGIDLKING